MWVRIDDGFPWHPKVAGLTGDEFRTAIEGMCYAARYLTDGHVLPVGLTRPEDAAALVRAGLWTRSRDGWDIHDWADWNPSAATVQARRKADRERRARYRHGDGGKYDGGASHVDDGGDNL